MNAKANSWYSDIGVQIRHARLAGGWTQEQFGGWYGVSHAAISDLERGKTKPNVDELMVLARILHTSLAQLLAAPLAARPLPPTTEVSNAATD